MLAQLMGTVASHILCGKPHSKGADDKTGKERHVRHVHSHSRDRCNIALEQVKRYVPAANHRRPHTPEPRADGAKGVQLLQ